jgi:hypothetical protein
MLLIMSGKRMLNHLLIIGVVSFLLQSCSGITVSQDYDQGFDFSPLKTFAWMPHGKKDYGLTDNDLVDVRIRTAIESKLNTRSYARVESDEADFYVSYEVTVEQKISSSNVSGGISLGRSSRGRYGGVGMSTGSQASAYDQGTMLIDITDVKTDRLIWRGVSTQQVSEHTDPDKSTVLINETVEKVLQQFPPQP